MNEALTNIETPLFILKKCYWRRYWQVPLPILVGLGGSFLIGKPEVMFPFIAMSLGFFVFFRGQAAKRVTIIEVYREFLIFNKPNRPVGEKLYFNELKKINATFNIYKDLSWFYLDFYFRPDCGRKENKITIRHDFYQRELRPLIDLIDEKHILVTMEDNSYKVSLTRPVDRL